MRGAGKRQLQQTCCNFHPGRKSQQLPGFSARVQPPDDRQRQENTKTPTTARQPALRLIQCTDPMQLSRAWSRSHERKTALNT